MNDVNPKSLFRPTWATIDLCALAHNYDLIKNKLPPRTGVLAMIKADAYGHGAVPVAKTLKLLGVSAFGVATVEEGLELRTAGIDTQILVMGGLMGLGVVASGRMIEANLTPVIHSSDVLNTLNNDAIKFGKKIAVHLKVDTGMSRLGVRPEFLPQLLDKLDCCNNLFIEGVMTHLAQADHPEVSGLQMGLFLACKKTIEEKLGKIKIWHIANSMALVRGGPLEIAGADRVWVRPGIALYDKVMRLESRIALLKRVPEGVKVSYGGTFKTERPTRLAIVPIGYADGYPWAASGKAQVLIGGRRLPVAGRVTMDMIIVDVTDLENVSVGDEVVLLGKQGSEEIEIQELADWAGTITYEILCGISKRMPRLYVNYGKCS